MVQRGIRKRLNDDLEAQKASIEMANYQHQADLDKERLRYSVAWYHVASDQWLEVEVKVDYRYGNKVTLAAYSEKPERFLNTTWGIKSNETGEFYRTEAGFIADGLAHAVWVSGGKWNFNRREHSSRYQFDHGESKIKRHQQLIANISRLPQIFYDLYGIKISIPMIQEAFKEYQDGGG